MGFHPIGRLACHFYTIVSWNFQSFKATPYTVDLAWFNTAVSFKCITCMKRYAYAYSLSSTATTMQINHWGELMSSFLFSSQIVAHSLTNSFRFWFSEEIFLTVGVRRQVYIAVAIWYSPKYWRCRWGTRIRTLLMVCAYMWFLLS